MFLNGNVNDFSVAIHVCMIFCIMYIPAVLPSNEVFPYSCLLKIEPMFPQMSADCKKSCKEEGHNNFRFKVKI